MVQLTPATGCHRVWDNLLDTGKFCSIIRRTEKIDDGRFTEIGYRTEGVFLGEHGQCSGTYPGGDQVKLDWMKKFSRAVLQSFEACLDDEKTGRFCNGDRVNMADCCFVPQLYNAQRWGIDYSDLTKSPQSRKPVKKSVYFMTLILTGVSKVEYGELNDFPLLVGNFFLKMKNQAFFKFLPTVK
ncbi:MAG: hypothetical protein GY761_12820 [Hyphomicrobiales bacterium]|nr:hypothetical protein [Hyphomicrobiales bacterium]